MANLSRLSAELVILITEQLDADSLVSFSHTDRRLYAIASSVYFRQEAKSETSTLLFWAARHGRIGVVQKLIDHGAVVNRRDTSGTRPPKVKHRPGPFDYHGTWSSALQAQHVPESDDEDFAELDYLDDLSESEFLEEEWEHIARAQQPSWAALHLAAAYGHDDIVELLLKNGAEIDAEASGLCRCGQPSKGSRDNYLFPYQNPTWTALHTAICQGHDATAQRLVNMGASLVTVRDPRGAETSAQEISSRLWEEPDPDGDYNLGHLEHDPKPLSAPGRPWYTALHYTAAYGSLAMVEFIHKAGPEYLDMPDAAGQTPLAYAFRLCRLDDIVSYLFQQVVKLIELGASVDRVAPESAQSALHLCCSDNPKAIGQMSEAWPWWPRPKAVEASGHETEPYRRQAVEALLKAGAKVDILDARAQTPLSYAAGSLSLSVVQLLLERGASPSSVALDEDGRPQSWVRPDDDFDSSSSPLMAIARSFLNCVEDPLRAIPVFDCILQAGADVNYQNKYGNTVLHILCRDLAKEHNRRRKPRLLKHVEALLGSGSVDYSLRNDEGKLAIQYVFVEELIDIAQLFPIDAAGQHLTSTDLICIRDGIIGSGPSGGELDDNIKALALLHRVNPRFVFEKPETLFTAIIRGNGDLAVHLIDHGGDCSYVSTAGESLLHIACRKRLYPVINRLLQAGLPADKPCKTGDTPLSIYIDSVLAMALGGPVDWDRHPSIVALIKHGADPHRVVCKPPLERPKFFYSWFRRPLDRIISRGDHAFAREILELCPPPLTSEDSYGLRYSYLHCACSFSYKIPDPDFVGFLLSLGLDVNERDYYGRTVLAELVTSIKPTRPWISAFQRTSATTSQLLSSGGASKVGFGGLILAGGYHSPLFQPDVFLECVRLVERHGAEWTMQSVVLPPSAPQPQPLSDEEVDDPTPAEELARHLSHAGDDAVSMQGLEYIRSRLSSTAWTPEGMARGDSPFVRGVAKRSLELRQP
ncbi:ankyrin repeat-containing domain protein [Microdochium bolleyi]|uniref:Ankyrin repeat-containing domain protein n=1 Tax=Microdochium bolleyi TaxID=196109 RepID=A0A136JE10_9PEZI|nr:ankyrin repeat-containing domain protein [Microdochium bolleyi]